MSDAWCECMQVQLLPPQSEMAAVCLMGDPDRLKGVLLNLFSNAAKFTPSGFICVRLRKCMAQEVASETHINPERSYKMCLQVRVWPCWYYFERTLTMECMP